MPTDKNLLNKGRFVLASECPRRLYYETRKDKYADLSEQNEFLESLAEGGHQVGALAKCSIPGGIEVETLKHDEAVTQTDTLLQQDEVVIYEAAFSHEYYFIRADIVVKNGNHVQLIEVKAKSLDVEKGFLKHDGFVRSEWIPYLGDIAFQTWVVRQARPSWQIEPSLMLINGDALTHEEGLHQLFRIERDGRVRVPDDADLATRIAGQNILARHDVADIVERFIAGEAIDPRIARDESVAPIAERARRYATMLQVAEPPPIGLGAKCKKCPFKNDESTAKAGKLSGLDQCWRERIGDSYDPEKPKVIELWNYRGADEMIQQGTYWLEDLPTDRLHERQVRQIEMVGATGAGQEWIDQRLRAVMSGWAWPLHFVDFETMSPAIPFHAGIHPYESIAFQFSCHTLHEDGRVDHDEFIAAEPGRFPNYDFLIALRGVLDRDSGTIFRYAAHENTILRHIHAQLSEGRCAPPAQMDASAACSWIDSITENKTNGDRRRGRRNMVDMCRLVKDHYYHRKMGGSFSIKSVLQAVMATSDILRNEYSVPLTYGTNLVGETLYVRDSGTGKVIDPYKLLPPVFTDIDPTEIEHLDADDEIREGGAAMTAYARIQFTEVSIAERQAIIDALLRYCELDTLAMLMLYQHWDAKLR